MVETLFFLTPTTTPTMKPTPTIKAPSAIHRLPIYFNDKCTEKGWILKNFSGAEKKGSPSCVLQAPKDVHCYIEFRAPGKAATPLQKYELKGVVVFVVNSRKNADILLTSIQKLVDAG